jgi:hypothetical protein
MARVNEPVPALTEAYSLTGFEMLKWDAQSLNCLVHGAFFHGNCPASNPSSQHFPVMLPTGASPSQIGDPEPESSF